MFLGFSVKQWGDIEQYSVSSTHLARVSYPIDFPLKVFSVLISPQGIADLMAAKSESNSWFTVPCGTKIENLYAFWLAIGK